MSRVVVEGLTEVMQSAKDGDRTLRVELRRAVAASVAQGALEAKQRAPYRSGRLQDSIVGRMAPGYDRIFIGFVEADAPYAPYVEEDTEPHEIKATNAKALRFEQNGEVLLRRAVHHKGTKGQHFMAESVAVVESTLKDYTQQAADKAIAKF